MIRIANDNDVATGMELSGPDLWSRAGPILVFGLAEITEALETIGALGLSGSTAVAQQLRALDPVALLKLPPEVAARLLADLRSELDVLQKALSKTAS